MRVETGHVLNGWLTDHGVQGSVVGITHRGIVHFHRRTVPSVFGTSAPVGITAMQGDYGPHVWLYLLQPSPEDGDPKEALKINDLAKRFSDEVAIPVSPWLSVHLELVSPADVKPRSFGRVLREGSQSAGVEFLGILRRSR